MATASLQPSRLEAAIKPENVGFALIVTNDYKTNQDLLNLEATESDGQVMKAAFEQLGYATIYQHNVTLVWLLSTLKKLDQISYSPSCKRIAFVFAGHGSEPQNGEEGTQTQLVTNDGRTISVSTVVQYMSPCGSSSTIGDRVRMFFIDACRGDNDDQGKRVMIHRGGKIAPECRISIRASNYILCYSTLAGFRSYEIRHEGNSHGIWLPVVANKLTTCDKSISDVMVEVNSQLSKQFQDTDKYPSMMQPTTSSTLNDTTVNLFREMPKELTSNTKVSPPSHCDILSSESHSVIQQVTPPLPTSSLPRAPAVNSPIQLREPLIRLSSTPSKCPSIAAKFPNCSQTHLAAVGQQQISCRAVASPCQSQLLLINTGLVHRHSTQFLSGHHRDLLNRLVQGNIITLSTYEHEDKQFKTCLYKSTAKCTIVSDGKVIVGHSKEYYSKKAQADEMAAKDIVHQLQQMGINLSASGKSSKPPVPVLPPSTRIFKQHVNNHFQGALMLDLPVYNTYPSGDGFQCCITHPKFPSLFGCESSIKGNVCSSKKDAENSAAWRIWTIFKRHN